MFRIWNMWFPWADTNCDSSLCRCCAAWLSLDPQAQFQSSLTTFQTLDAIIPWIQHVPKIPKQWKRRTDGIWWGFHAWQYHQYNFKISQMWIKLGNLSPCAPLLRRPLFMVLLGKSTNPIFWELPQSQEPPAPDLWQYMSGTKSLRKIFPKDVSGVLVQEPSTRSVQDPVRWSCGMITNISQDLSVQDLCPIACATFCYAKTVKGSRGHVCAAPAVQNWRSRPMPATWNNASTMRHTRGNHDNFKSTQSTHATQNNENILAAGMRNPCKAAQLNHIDRCGRTLHTLPVTPSPWPRSLENYFVEKYLRKM